MRYSLAVALLAITSIAQAQPLLSGLAPTTTRPKARVDICGCTGKSDCVCKEGSCFCRACSGRKAKACGCSGPGDCTCFPHDTCVCPKCEPPTPPWKTKAAPATLKLYRDLPAGTHGGAMVGVRVTLGEPLAAGEYDVVVSPKGKKGVEGPLPFGPLAYDIAQRWALRTNQPMVVFVGTPSMSIPGAVVSEQANLPGVAAPAVLIAVPTPTTMDWKDTLQGEQTYTNIVNAVQRALNPTPPVPHSNISPYQLAPSVIREPMMFVGGRGESSC